MEIVVAIDSFKGSLSSLQAGEAVKEGIKRVNENDSVLICPVADGGEGTFKAIMDATECTEMKVEVSGPLGERIKCSYGINEEKKTAIIEMSAAAGITLVPRDKRNPLYTSTYGVGEIILDAIKNGCRKFIIGIGGSSTNDGGVGMLQALGFEFLDYLGKQIPRGASGLENLVSIKTENVSPILNECEFQVACDVKNPLYGENGCSAVYGPQKGATSEMIANMDVWLKNYAALTKTVNPNADPDFPGSGAAGGLGFAFMSYLNGILKSGVDLVLEITGTVEKIKNADLVITGEGRLDDQSAMGKAPTGIAKTAKKYGKPVIAFAGCVTEGAKKCNQQGIDAFFPILKAPCSLEDAMDIENAFRNLADTAEQAHRLIKVFDL